MYSSSGFSKISATEITFFGEIFNSLSSIFLASIKSKEGGATTIEGLYLFNLSICSLMFLKVSKYSKLIKNEFIVLYKSLSALKKNAILCPKILLLGSILARIVPAHIPCSSGVVINIPLCPDVPEDRPTEIFLYF